MDVTSLHLPLSDDLPRSDSAAEADPPPSPDPVEPDTDTDSSGEYESDSLRLTPVGSLVSSLMSFEYAIVKIKDRSGVKFLQIYGEIKIVTRFGNPPYLYRRTESEADTIPYSPQDEGFVLPLSFPDWSLSDIDCYECEVQLYEAGEGGGGPLFSHTFCLLTRGDGSIFKALPDWKNKIHEPISLFIDNDRATFTLCVTRIRSSINACFNFRVINRADNSDYKGNLVVSGKITATQTLSNGESRKMTLFDSSSGVQVPPERPFKDVPLIPLLRPVIVTPVQTEEQVKAGGGPFVTVYMNLVLKEDGSGDQDPMNHVVEGPAEFHLKHDHGLCDPIFYSVEETNKRKHSSCSDQSGDNRLKIEIAFIPFQEYSQDDPYHCSRLLMWGIDKPQPTI